MPLIRMTGEEKQLGGTEKTKEKMEAPKKIHTHTHTELAAEIAYNPRLKFQQRGP